MKHKREGAEEKLYTGEGLLRRAPWGSTNTAQGLETREELGLQRRYMLGKGKSAVEGDPKKSWSGKLNRSRVPVTPATRIMPNLITFIIVDQ